MPAPFATRNLSIINRVGTISVGVALLFIVNKTFDYLVYPYAIFKFGIVFGGFIMTILSAISCFILLKFYDVTKKDWLGIETIKSIKEYKGHSKIGNFISSLLRKSDPFAFVILSICYDPFITTVWLRHKRFGVLTIREWRIFWGSVILANMFWIFSCWAGVNIFIWSLQQLELIRK